MRLVDDVQSRVELVVPPHDLDIVRAETEAPGLVDVRRSERDEDGDGETKPEQG